MKKRVIRAWFRNVPCGGQTIGVYFVLPDTFFDVALFSCPACDAILCIDRERERYIGNKFETLRSTLTCPTCDASLASAMEYPQTFRCPDGSHGHFDLPQEYPPDSDLVDLEVWDPYG